MTRSVYIGLKWTGLGIALIIAGAGVILGVLEDVPAQHVMFYATATFALVLWVWNYSFLRGGVFAGAEGGALPDSAGAGADATASSADGEDDRALPSSGNVVLDVLYRNKVATIGLLALLAIFIIGSATIEGFFSWINVLSMLIIGALFVVAVILNKFIVENKSAFIGMSVLLGLFVVGSLTVDGFFSLINLKSMLVFAAFLGLACVGQTLVALLGGLDLSIPFLIGAANVGLAYLFGLEVTPWIAVIVIVLLGGLVGVINGVLSFRLQGQALILTLGVGFAVSGGTQILTSIGTRYSGNVFGVVPGWLTNIAAMNGKTFGLNFPPVIFIWLIISVVLIIGMRNTVYGRNLYALGGNRRSSSRLSISERRYWIGAYAISGCFAALTGVLLLGWSGGGFIGVGNPYLFMTLAAVVIGGTSLLGGLGGYGYTVIGVLVLQVLTSFLVGIGLEYEGQQFVFGLLILPMVALYTRSPHIRTQI